MNNNFLGSFVCAFAIVAASTIVNSGCAAQGTATQPQTTAATQATGQAPHPALLDPTKTNLTAPPKFRVKFETTEGDFTIEVTRAWAPNGADRFYNMAKIGYFKDVAIFRAIKDFMFQFGIHGDPAVSAKWANSKIQDDPHVGVPNNPGTLSFAQTGQANSRSVQMFVNLGSNTFLDKPQRGGGSPFVPFAKIVEGMDVVKRVNTEYGENSPEVQGNFMQKGNSYIKTKYKNLDYIKTVTVIEMK